MEKRQPYKTQGTDEYGNTVDVMLSPETVKQIYQAEKKREMLEALIREGEGYALSHHIPHAAWPMDKRPNIPDLCRSITDKTDDMAEASDMLRKELYGMVRDYWIGNIMGKARNGTLNMAITKNYMNQWAIATTTPIIIPKAQHLSGESGSKIQEKALQNFKTQLLKMNLYDSLKELHEITIMRPEARSYQQKRLKHRHELTFRTGQYTAVKLKVISMEESKCLTADNLMELMADENAPSGNLHEKVINSAKNKNLQLKYGLAIESTEVTDLEKMESLHEICTP